MRAVARAAIVLALVALCLALLDELKSFLDGEWSGDFHELAMLVAVFAALGIVARAEGLLGRIAP